MIGNLTWGYFSSSFSAGQASLAGNAGLFSKVYFPRLVPTISSLISNTINFGVQFLLFIYSFPVFLIQMALFGMGCGLIISSFTVKYRDLLVLVGFGLSAWMYITPVIYASSTLSPTAYKILMCNPVAPVVELMRYGWIGCGTTPWLYWGLSWAVTFLICFLGIVAFNKTQKNFLDTV